MLLILRLPALLDPSLQPAFQDLVEMEVRRKISKDCRVLFERKKTPEDFVIRSCDSELSHVLTTELCELVSKIHEYLTWSGPGSPTVKAGATLSDVDSGRWTRDFLFRLATSVEGVEARKALRKAEASRPKYAVVDLGRPGGLNYPVSLMRVAERLAFQLRKIYVVNSQPGTLAIERAASSAAREPQDPARVTVHPVAKLPVLRVSIGFPILLNPVDPTRVVLDEIDSVIKSVIIEGDGK